MTTAEHLRRELIRLARLVNEAQVAAHNGDWHSVVAYLVEIQEHAARTEKPASQLARESVNPKGAKLTELLENGVAALNGDGSAPLLRLGPGGDFVTERRP